MSQSSMQEQVADFVVPGLSIQKGTRVIARDPANKIDLRLYGSDVWFSRWCHNIFQNFPVVSKCLGARFLHEACHGMPAFVVGVGPSLDDAIQDLKKAKGRAVVICTDAALRALLAAGIQPDLVVNLDAQDIQHKLWQEIPAGTKIPALLNSCCHPKTWQTWPGPILFYNQYHTQDDLCKRILPDVLPELGQIPSCGTVGNMAMFAAHLMGCDPVCAVGMDFCYQPAKSDVVAWRYRAQDYRFTSDRAAGVPPGWEKTVIKELYDNDERLARSSMVKGEDGKEFRTDPELSFYLESFTNLMPHFKVPVVNCTPNGMIPPSFPAMTVNEAISRYCDKEFQGGRSVLAHLAKIAPDPRPVTDKPFAEWKTIE